MVVCASLLSLVSQCLRTALLLRSAFIGVHSGGDGTLPKPSNRSGGDGKVCVSTSSSEGTAREEWRQATTTSVQQGTDPLHFPAQIVASKSNLARLHPFYSYKGLAIPQSDWVAAIPSTVGTSH